MKDFIRSTASLCAGIIIFVGLPVLGWGIWDAGGFFAHPARALYAALAVILSLWVVATIPNAGRSRGRGQKVIERQHVALVLLQFLSIGVVVFAPYCDRRDIAVLVGVEVLRYVGLGAYGSGFILMNVAVAALDRQFSTEVTIQENHRLVTDGPYRILRHPRYTGIIVFFLGISLVFRSGIALLLVLLVTGVLLWRVHDEEALMKKEFGFRWDQYAETTWRLIPYIY